MRVLGVIALVVVLGGVAFADTPVVGRITAVEVASDQKRTLITIDKGFNDGVTRHHIGCLLYASRDQCRANAIVVRVSKTDTVVVVELPIGNVDKAALVRLYADE